MRDTGRLFKYRIRGQIKQMGFTLVELLIALAISGIIIVGVTAIARILIVNSANATDRAVASQQVHYVMYWISQDVVQAKPEEINVGNITSARCPTPFLTLKWNFDTGNQTVTYCVEDMKDKFNNNLWRLYRTKTDEYGAVSTSMTAEYLINPWTVIPPEKEALGDQSTRCTLEGNVTADENLVKLQVGALIDKSVAAAIYQIYPRANPNLGNFTE